MVYYLSVPIFNLRNAISAPTRSRIPVSLRARPQAFLVYYPTSLPTPNLFFNQLKYPTFLNTPVSSLQAILCHLFSLTESILTVMVTVKTTLIKPCSQGRTRTSMNGRNYCFHSALMHKSCSALRLPRPGTPRSFRHLTDAGLSRLSLEKIYTKINGQLSILFCFPQTLIT